MTKGLNISKKRLQELLAAYGADPSRWPEDEQDMAEAIDHRDFENDLAAAADLDRLLAALPAPAPASDALMERLLDIPAHAAPVTGGRGTARRVSWLTGLLALPVPSARRLIPQAVGLVVAGYLGVALGLSGVARPPADVEVFDASGYLLGDPGLVRDLEDVD